MSTWAEHECTYASPSLYADSVLASKPADFDNDGSIDIFLSRGAWTYAIGGRGSTNHPDGNTLLTKNRVLTMRDWAGETFKEGVQCAGNSAEWADYDLDGLLDLYVGCEGSDPCQLWHNRGNGWASSEN